LREGEEKQLLDYFNNTTGSYADRAEEAFWMLTGAPQTTVLKNFAAIEMVRKAASAGHGRL
jgi:hypothetical protein